MKEYNIKWCLCILSTKSGEWSLPNRLDQTELTNDTETLNHNSGHKILELPALNNKKITIREFIKYLLNIWKTKQFVRDHRPTLWSPLANMSTCYLISGQNVLITCSSGSSPFSHNGQQACEDTDSFPTWQSRSAQLNTVPSPSSGHG